MHWTLTLKSNIGLIVMWAVASAILLSISSQPPILPIVIGAVGGAISGLAQSQAIKSNRSSFISAESALETRQAMSATRAGKLAIAVQWVTTVTILVTFVQSDSRDVLGLIGSVTVFFLVRDILSIPGVISLQRVADNGA